MFLFNKHIFINNTYNNSEIVILFLYNNHIKTLEILYNM